MSSRFVDSIYKMREGKARQDQIRIALLRYVMARQNVIFVAEPFDEMVRAELRRREELER